MNVYNRIMRYLSPLSLGVGWLRYMLAAVIAVVALVLDSSVLPVSMEISFLALYLATNVTALLLGAGPTLLVLIIGVLAGPYFLTAPDTSYSLNVHAWLSILVLTSTGLMVSGLARQKARAIQDHQALSGQLQRIIVQYEEKEAQLRQQLREIENIYTHTPVGMCMLDHHYRYVRINQVLADIHGAPMEAHIGRTIYEILPDLLTQQIEELYQPVFATGKASRNIEISAHTKDGVRTWLCSVIPLRSVPDGAVSHVIGVVQEVTEYKQLEAALRASEKKARHEEKRFRDIAASSAETFFEFDGNEVITYFSSTDKFDNSSLIGKSIKGSFLLTQEDYVLNKASLDSLNQAIRERRPYTKLEFNSPYQGRREIFSVSAIPVFDEDGKYCGYRGSSCTVTNQLRETELLRAKAMADSANTAKGEFLAIMSHEIRTPMSAVIGLAELAAELEMSPRVRDYLVKIVRSSKSLLRIINDILDFSKIEAGKITFEMSEFFLRDVFTSVGNIFRAKCVEKNIELVLCMSEECSYRLYGDPLRLEQVLINLVGNAIKFTEAGEVEVQVRTVRESSNQVMMEFSVRDTGVGMSDGATEEIFRPFIQADTSITRRFGGTGLGLSISRKLVEMMGGTIWVRSQIGSGSVFYFTSEMQRRLDAEFGDMVPPEDMEHLSVLVIDDNDAARNALTRIMKSFNFLVAASKTPQDALCAIKQSIVENSPYQLVLVDHFLCGIDGVEMIKQFREMIAPSSFPKIILLVNSDPDDELYAIGHVAGVGAYLTKPVGCSLLFDTIMDVFGKEMTKSFSDKLERVNTKDVVERIGGARVLLAEDNAINQQVAVEILENIGLSVDVAKNGVEAVVKVTKADYDIVLMDIHMPQMDGYQASRQIRKDPRFCKLPIVAMTANAMTGDREKCLSAGMNDHVAKPINKADLYAKLMKWIFPRAGIGLGCYPLLERTHPTIQKVTIPATLAGIEVHLALERLDGNTALYHSLLSAFHRDYATANDRMRTLLAGKRKDDIENAAILAHTIKGLAGNISAIRLFDAAAVLEQATPYTSDEKERAFLQFESALQEVITAIEGLKQQEQEVIQPSSMVGVADYDPARITTLITELSALLHQRAYKAKEVFRALKMLLANAPLEIHHEVQRLEESIEKIDFPDAQRILGVLANRLALELPGPNT